MDFALVVNQMIVLFLIIVIGYLSARMKVIDQTANEKFSRLIINVTLPAIIISSVTGGPSQGSAQGNLGMVAYMLLVAVVVTLIRPLIAIPVARILRVPREDEGLYRFMFIFSNIIFMGFPVVRSIFGEEAIFFASLFHIPFSLIIYTHGVRLAKREYGWGGFNLKKIVNPGLIAVIVAMAIYVTGIRLPYFLSSTFQLVGSITTPLSLIAIGASLATIPLKEVFTEKRLYPFALITLVIVPLLTLLVASPLIQDKIILGVTVIFSGMPAATMAYMFETEYKGNPALAAKGIMLTTLLSLITIPLIALLIYAVSY